MPRSVWIGNILLLGVFNELSIGTLTALDKVSILMIKDGDATFAEACELSLSSSGSPDNNQ